ncbi:hypothetical protein GE21DRAFT_2992 [Neurospora crassa]|uniref:Pathway-specific nitrogen regulator n=2 Tax=Neurospora crassa TaxID=5141 RepID=Q1K8R3_NEUCR|nr:pathway-specific nitrogen regulator [Neurospora crassa OR74A]EAA34263.2 pathway-specific nitrogen regulator [Neurospora crassa OR74A]KHE85293.1 hypothetical protein GE21DRAFT_2992 [Neurospora crassa]|eukprot:XP_963499.2 pathway-specific nitrogen regulator [Neurospora crassa OR74A]
MTLMTAPLPPPKQIRFVNNQGQPPSKRRRINAACLTCRKRKTRCAGEKPVCSTCTKNGHQCQGYNDLVERRKEDNRGNGLTKGDHDQVAGVKREADDDDDDDEHSDDNEEEEAEEPHRQWKSKTAPASKTAGFAVVDRDASMRRDSIPNHSYSGTRPRGLSNDWGQDSRSPSSTRTARQSNSNGIRSPTQHHSHSVRRRDRIPYFRYFGPTAIVPGFKQNLPKEPSFRDPRFMRTGSSVATTPTPSHHIQPRMIQETLKDIPTLEDMPVYSTDDSKPVPEIIKVLVKTFFIRLGCNYPFLKEERFMRQLEEKQVEPILVDAMCALAARFSELPTFTNEQDGSRVPKSEYGDVFAQRVKNATVETFSCPSVAAVQAFLLMAYEAFGANQDSALWMYLGLAIRMATDLGLQKKEGVKYQGSRDPWFTRRWLSKYNDDGNSPTDKQEEEETISPEEQKEVEQARIDTFWAVFMLDRIISSGTGRPVTLRDDDMDLEIPEPTLDQEGWPDPFPACIKIIHLYGRASDVLNNIRDANDLTEESMKKLRQMESDLTIIYSKQHERLVFNTHNFKHYVEAGQGTIFILLHFWFHAMIIILHEPALLTPFGKLTNIQLLSNSRELARSSAKTIADIVAFAELIDHQSYIGNPFTSQPIFIAGCAFLKESALSASSPPSREQSPGANNNKSTGSKTHGGRLSIPTDNRPRHSLLTSAAAANYSRCSQALARVEQYWAGVGYILNAMEQRSQGIEDCETFAPGELERMLARTRQASVQRLMGFENPIPPSPGVPPIAFSLTGTTNSPNSNLTRLYTNTSGTTSSPSSNLTRIYTNTANPTMSNNFMLVPSMSSVASPLPPTSQPTTAATPPGNMIYDPIRQDTPTVVFHPPPHPQPNVPAARYQGRSSSFSHLRDRRSTSTLSRGTSLKYETPGSDDMTVGSDSPTISESNFNAYGKSLSPALPPLAPPPHRHSYLNSPSTQHASTPFDNTLLSPPSGPLTDPGGLHHQNQNQQQQHHGHSGHNSSPSYQTQGQTHYPQQQQQQQQHHNNTNNNNNSYDNSNHNSTTNNNDYYHQATSRPSPNPGLGVVDPFNQNTFSTGLYSAFTPDFMFECNEINLHNLPDALGLDAIGDSHMMESLSNFDAYAWYGLFDETFITGGSGGDGGNGNGSSSHSRGNDDDGGGRRGGDQGGGGRNGQGGGDGRGHQRQGH